MQERGNTMSNSQGNFVWYELVTSDTTAAEAFYGKVVGWDAQAPQGAMFALVGRRG
jgi:predicted enzyme related to lactoylglutathione lyase